MPKSCNDMAPRAKKLFKLSKRASFDNLNLSRCWERYATLAFFSSINSGPNLLPRDTKMVKLKN